MPLNYLYFIVSWVGMAIAVLVPTLTGLYVSSALA